MTTEIVIAEHHTCTPPKAQRRDYLSQNEQAMLMRKAQQGDIGARNYLVESNLALAKATARRARKPNTHLYDDDDKFQDAALAMIEAVHTFDEAKSSPTAHLASSMGYKLRQTKREKKESEIQTISLYTPITEEDEDMLIDLIPNTAIKTPEEEVIVHSQRRAIHNALSRLPSHLQDVLRLSFGIDPYHKSHDAEEIAEVLGVSKAKVKGLLFTAMRKLRAPNVTDQLQLFYS